jgi:regulator of sirC expression with transglutaminase-like and TPR domain
VLRDLDELGRKAGDSVCAALGIPRKEAKHAAARQPNNVIRLLGEFWREEGFHGSTESFYSDRNSYIPDVLERRTGLPIALSVVYLALARRVFLDADGVGLPGHFIVRVVNVDRFELIDPFEGARSIAVEECRRRVESVGYPFIPEDHLKPVTPREILARMCNNLLALFDQQKKIVEAERVVTVLSHLQPRDPIPLLLRAERRLRRGDRKGARIDFERAHALDPNGPIGRTALEEMLRMGYENPFA